ncbi:hypothetical protein Tco_1405354 [Tanacetum coccineum]
MAPAGFASAASGYRPNIRHYKTECRTSSMWTKVTERESREGTMKSYMMWNVSGAPHVFWRRAFQGPSLGCPSVCISSSLLPKRGLGSFCLDYTKRIVQLEPCLARLDLVKCMLVEDGLVSIIALMAVMTGERREVHMSIENSVGEEEMSCYSTGLQRYREKENLEKRLRRSAGNIQWSGYHQLRTARRHSKIQRLNSLMDIMRVSNVMPFGLTKAPAKSMDLDASVEACKEENIGAEGFLGKGEPFEVRSDDLIIPLDEVRIDEKLHFIEEPIEIMDREVKQLKQIWIPIVKVRWNSSRRPEYTWEREDQMWKKYPHLFDFNKKQTTR